MAILDSITNLARGVGSKAEDVIENGRTALKINSERTIGNDCIQKIGQYYYDRFLRGEPVDADAVELFAEAKKHFSAADEMQAQLDADRQARVDAKEAAREAANAPTSYTTPLSDRTAYSGAVSGKGVCPVCGADVTAGMRFCTQCGTPL